MKYLKLFESFEDIDSICKKYFRQNTNKKNYVINSDGSVDVYGNVIIYFGEDQFTKLPLKFGNVRGFFSCRNNALTSLEGCPKFIGGDFYCEYNDIRTFEGFPINLGGDFNCMGNPIYELWRLFRDREKVELFNDFGITDGEVVILDRLNEFLEMIGRPTGWIHHHGSLVGKMDISDIKKAGYKII